MSLFCIPFDLRMRRSSGAVALRRSCRRILECCQVRALEALGDLDRDAGVPTIVEVAQSHPNRERDAGRSRCSATVMIRVPTLRWRDSSTERSRVQAALPTTSP